MDVAVDEAGQYQFAAQILHRNVAGQFRQKSFGRADVGHSAFIDQKDTVVEVLRRFAFRRAAGIRDAVIDRCPERFLHLCGSTSMTGSSR